MSSVSATPRESLWTARSVRQACAGIPAAAANRSSSSVRGAPGGGTVTTRIRSRGIHLSQTSSTRSASWRSRKDAPALGEPSSRLRTPAANSHHGVVAPMTTDCCQAEVIVRARSRRPTTTKTSWPSSARTIRFTCRGRARASSSSDITTRLPG